MGGWVVGGVGCVQNWFQVLHAPMKNELNFFLSHGGYMQLVVRWGHSDIISFQKRTRALYQLIFHKFNWPLFIPIHKHVGLFKRFYIV